MKKCKKCGLIKKFNEFHKDKQQKNGYTSYCKNCKFILGKERYKKAHPPIIDFKDEYWITLLGYDKLYLISNFGRIKYLSQPLVTKNGINTFTFERIIKFVFVKEYPKCTLFKNGSKKMFFVHRLVAINFIPNPLNKPQVNHIDGNKGNYQLNNLEWCTAKENTLHAIKNGLLIYRKK